MKVRWKKVKEHYCKQFEGDENQYGRDITKIHNIMTDKVQKIREAVEKRYEYWREKEFSHSIESEIRMSECKHLLLMLDSLQEEPVSEELEEAASKYAKEEYNRKNPATLPDRCKGCYAPLMYAFKAGSEWYKTKNNQRI